MRKRLIAGNWKMNLGWNDAMTLVADLAQIEQEEDWKSVDVMLFPPAIYARHSVEFLKNSRSGMKVGLQDCASTENGAFTGEISATMIAELGATSVIIGHSERRQYFRESDDQLLEKVRRALEAGLTPIFCCGESLEDRKAERHEEIVVGQLTETIFQMPADVLKNVVIAYEPVWAIGTGETASPAQAQAMHAAIRAALVAHKGDSLAKGMRILYGGSMKPGNAEELLSQPDVDGGLIGGASLKAEDFAAIINAS